MTPFSHPAHRTGQADLPHPALGQDFTPLLSRATPSAVSEHSAEFIGCPISRSFTTYFVCLAACRRRQGRASGRPELVQRLLRESPVLRRRLKPDHDRTCEDNR